MNRFFLRIYLGVLAAAVLGMVLATAVARVPYDLDLLEDHRAYVDTIHPSLVDDLENSPKRDWREVTDWWEGVSEYEIHVLPRDDPFWADKEGFQVPLDEPVFAVSSGYRTDEIWVARPIPDTDLVVYYYLRDPFSLRYMATGALGYMLIFSVMAGAIYLMLRPVIRSTQDLTSTVQAYADGRLDARVKVVKGTGPLSRLSTQFNRMAGEIQHKIQEQEVMTTAISHELKTPLTRLRLALDMALASEDERKRGEMLVTMDHSLDDLDELTAELLKLAKLTYSGERLEVERVALSGIFERLIRELEDIAPEVKVTLGGAVQLACRGHEEHLYRAFSNLLINGKRYARSVVNVQLLEDEHEVVVWVEDDGPGVPLERRDEVFMPFARIDRSRSRHTGGFGLGLAIAKQSLEVQGGTIHVESSSMGGACFVVRLPKATSILG